MTPALDRLRKEQAFHDRQAAQRKVTFRAHPELLRVSDDEYLDHASWIRPAFALLGDVAGRRVLDFGCGHGMAAVIFARRGARVTALDLSQGYVSEARCRSEANKVSIQFLQADAENVPLADESFDRIFGNAILHHLDIERAAREVRRLLKPGGWAIFCEPWNGNPLWRWARSSRWLAAKEHTATEAPLLATDLDRLRRVFPDLAFWGHEFLPRTRGLRACDRWLLRCWPQLRAWCRYVVLQLVKQGNTFAPRTTVVSS
ncbi:MAG: class I SAM-dependent methyltransferase [Gemmataceae bacterium]|nr:class I SAM-dependent methyltransferase [Gemmataceae bacterium]MCI0741875.1 class I SAM-dependent methyltransferase [Gemmataceae bacterium]